MCRVVAYLGEPVLLDVLLYQSDSSLVKQAYAPSMMSFMNLAGCGIACWNDDAPSRELPLTYKSTTLPMYDRNLAALSRKVECHCALAHIRGAEYDGAEEPLVSESNLHPFRYEDCRVTLAHNGGLSRFSEMKYDLLEHIDPEVAREIEGNTDSEWIYAVLLSQLEDPRGATTATELTEAVARTLAILKEVRNARGIDTDSHTNLFVSDGASLVATRFTFDFGCYADEPTPSSLSYPSLWYTAGHDYGLHEGDWKMLGGANGASSALIASEPLTRDISTWIEVPEYTLLTLQRLGGRLQITTRELDL